MARQTTENKDIKCIYMTLQVAILLVINLLIIISLYRHYDIFSYGLGLLLCFICCQSFVISNVLIEQTYNKGKDERSNTANKAAINKSFGYFIPFFRCMLSKHIRSNKRNIIKVRNNAKAK